MRKYLYLTFLLAVPILLFAQQKKSTLFVGNSYVAVNNLPQTTALVALSIGDTLLVSSYTPGGYTLLQHSNDVNCLNAINSMPWDFVALQEQSQMPSFPQSQVEQAVFPAARKLDSMIHLNNACTQTLFYMTWGRKNGDASNCANWPPICTYTGMDGLLRQRYEFMADTNHAACAPVGAVWRYIRTHFPSVNLYQADESHPTLEGTFAAACTFNTLIFHRDPSLVTYNNGIASSIADSIKMAVKAVAYDSLWYWERNQRKVNASFITTIQSDTVYFLNGSTIGANCVWNFGDGQTDTVLNPTHIYSLAGTYNVMLMASLCGFTDTTHYQITISSDTVNTILNNVVNTTNVYSIWKENQLCVRMKDETATPATISLFGANGQLLETASWNIAKGEWSSVNRFKPNQLIYIKVQFQNRSVTLKTISSE